MGSDSDQYDLDSILNQLGNFGKFQLINYAFVCLSIAFNAIFTVSFAFTAGNVDYRCAVPECESEVSKYSEPWLNYTIPFKHGLPLTNCERYLPIFLNETVNSTWYSNDNDTCSSNNFDTSNTIRCNKFVFKDDEVTIANEWNILCQENEWKLGLVGSINNIGQFFGMLLGGYISDRYGRRAALVFSGMGSSVMGVLRSFSSNYIMFVSFEFLDAALGSCLYSAAMILAIEFVAPEKRVMSCTILAAWYAIGEVALALGTKYIREWRTVLRVLYIPGCIHLLYFWTVPESVRWLLTQGRQKEAINILRKAAKLNNIRLSETDLKKLENPEATQNTNEPENITSNGTYPLLQAFKSPKMRWRAINCSFCWLTNTLVYYGLSLNSVSLVGDKYLNFMVVCLAEIPGIVVAYFAMNRIGRRISQSGSLILSGIACLIYIFINSGQWAAGLTLFLIGKLAITSSFAVIYVYTTELFPTNLRHSLLSFCSTFGRVGSIVAPLTPLMAQYYKPFPVILFGSCSLLSGLLVLFFPETLNTTLPNTIEEAERIGIVKKKYYP